MGALGELTVPQLEALLKKLRGEYREYQRKGLRLDMSRGKPNTEQLNLCQGMLDTVTSSLGAVSESGIDCRNYGFLDGLPEVRKLLADMLGVEQDEIIVGGNSSLNMMYDCMTRALLSGVYGSDKPWCKEPEIKFLCPVPGYDRHFTICESLGIEMINIPLTEWGPDMDLVDRLVAEDETIKGIWCVPKYTNPLGGSYSDEAVRRLANLKPKAKDFRIFWDNAYNMHYVYRHVPILNILEECKKAGNPDLVYIFGSTSKISFPGAGVAFFGASKENVDFTLKQLNAQSISWDKMNMLRHVRFFQDLDGLRAHLDKHAALLRPKFDAVLHALEGELASAGVGTWVTPCGGYFVTYMSMPGCAKRIVSLCKEAGVVLTDAGATHPYHKDPEDSYIRLAPSFPSPEELAQAMEVFCTAANLAAVEKLLG